MSATTIGDLIVLLRNCEADARVEFDFPARPTTIASWRGIYAEPALGHSSHWEHDPTVADLIRELENAIDGRTFEGWKGGDYSYSADQILQVANPGAVGHLVISGIAGRSHCAILKTEFQESW